MNRPPAMNGTLSGAAAIELGGGEEPGGGVDPPPPPPPPPEGGGGAGGAVAEPPPPPEMETVAPALELYKSPSSFRRVATWIFVSPSTSQLIVLPVTRTSTPLIPCSGTVSRIVPPNWRSSNGYVVPSILVRSTIPIS